MKKLVADEETYGFGRAKMVSFGRRERGWWWKRPRLEGRDGERLFFKGKTAISLVCEEGNVIEGLLVALDTVGKAKKNFHLPWVGPGRKFFFFFISPGLVVLTSRIRFFFSLVPLPLIWLQKKFPKFVHNFSWFLNKS